MSNLSNAQGLYQMIGEGKILDAFEKYYHDDVVMIEATGDVFEGKDANRKREEDFVASLKEMHGGGVDAITVDESNNVTMVETWIDATFQDGNRMKMEQVAVQRWEGDKIIKERFYYNMPS